MTALEVRDLIGDDLWQATNTGAVSIEQFQKLDEAVAKLTDADELQDFRTLCEQGLEEKNKNSIAIRYLMTVTGKHPTDDRHILQLLEQYYEESLLDQTIFLAKKILSFRESSYVLKVLADCYSVKNMTEQKIEIWERLVHVDMEETEVLYKLADYYEKKGNESTALGYYSSILRRNLKNQDLSSLRIVWDKIMDLKAEDTSYLINQATKIAETIGKGKGAFALKAVLEKVPCDLNTRIELLKKIIYYDPTLRSAKDLERKEDDRDSLIKCWREKYKDNPRLEYCLNNTGIMGEYMDINVAIENFEKQIEFVEGAFVYHETWKLGRINKIDKDEMIVQFAGKGLHTMNTKMAYSSLKILPKRHILVLKAAVPKDKLAAKFLEKDNVEWGLKVLLGSYNDKASLKQMKTELVPSILDDKQWTVWLASAKKELSTNPYFGISESSPDVFTLRSTPITFEEKEFALFKAAKDIWEKIRILKDFLAQNGGVDSDEFSSMVRYFVSKAQFLDPRGEALVCFLVLDNLINRKGLSIGAETKAFLDYYNAIPDVEKFFQDIQDTEVKRSFIENVRDNVEKWQDVVISLYPYYTCSFMERIIAEGPKKNAIYKILSNSIENYKEDPDFFLYLEKTFSSKEWAKAKVTADDLLKTRINLLAYVNRKIANSSDVADNKKRQKQLTATLFSKDNLISAYLKSADASQAQMIYSMLRGIPDLETERLSVKNQIANLFPNDWEAIIGENPTKAIEKKSIVPKGLLCTKAMLESKSMELENLMNVEIPANSKDIGAARELGDLRENSEYQYAKEKQKFLNRRMNELTDEVSSAQVILPENVDTSMVSFGTTVVFADNKAGKDITYTILGPWESDPNRNILNFKSPLGQAIYNMEKDENRKFNINGVDYDYTVKSIKLADF